MQTISQYMIDVTSLILAHDAILAHPVSTHILTQHNRFAASIETSLKS